MVLDYVFQTSTSWNLEGQFNQKKKNLGMLQQQNHIQIIISLPKKENTAYKKKCTIGIYVLSVVPKYICRLHWPTVTNILYYILH